MFVTPLEHATYFPVSMREVAVVDSNNYTVFIRFLGELAKRHRKQLLYGERHATFVMTTSIKVDQASRSLLSRGEVPLWASMAASTITFHQSLRHNDLLQGVREQIEKDSSIREAVKKYSTSLEGCSEAGERRTTYASAIREIYVQLYILEDTLDLLNRWQINSKS